MEMKRVPLMLAPSVDWFAEIILEDKVELISEDKFVERSFRNKMEITGINGKQVLSIPIVKQTRKLSYRKVEISYQEHWQNEFIHALKSAYGRSPFFEYYDYKIEPILLHEYKYLWDLNKDLLDCVLALLKLNINLIVKEGDCIKDALTHHDSQSYYQVFADKLGFISNLSILDLLFNEGVDAARVLLSMKK